MVAKRNEREWSQDSSLRQIRGWRIEAKKITEDVGETIFRPLLGVNIPCVALDFGYG